MGWFTKSSKTPDVDEFADSTLASLTISTALANLSTSTSLKLAVASILRARMMNADTLSSLPVKAGQSLVPAPNKDQNTQEFVTEILLAMQDFGEAYVRRIGGELLVLPNAEVNATWNTDRTLRMYRYRRTLLRPRGVSKNLWVLAVNRSAGDLQGCGWMQSGRITGILATQAYIEQFFANNAKPSGILKSPREPTGDEARLIKAQWEAAREYRSTAVIPNSWEFDPMGFSPDDSSWAEAYMISVGDVATLSGVPGSLLNYNQPGSSLTYENVESVYQGYWRQTLKPSYASRITAMWTEILGQQVRFDPEELFLASMQDRAQAASVLANSGYEHEDVAEVVGFPPIGVAEVEAVEVPVVPTI